MAGIRYKGQIFSGTASTKSADEVSYDNTDSGLTATDVQGAVDEIVTALGQVIGSWESDVLDTKTYGSLFGFRLPNLKLGIIYWSGNSTQAPTGDITISIPDKYKPKREFVVPMKDSASGTWMSVRTNPDVRMILKGTDWTNATLVYPLA